MLKPLHIFKLWLIYSYFHDVIDTIPQDLTSTQGADVNHVITLRDWRLLHLIENKSHYPLRLAEAHSSYNSVCNFVVVFFR